MKLPKKLFHYSGSAVEKLIQRDYSIDPELIRKGICYLKPFGFWVSVEDFEEDQTWKSWCKSEEFNVEDLSYVYEIKVKDGSNILYLNSVKEIHDFSLKFGIIEEAPTIIDREPWITKINWISVVGVYDGIIIAPYQWSCRLFDPLTGWYYGWGCASGCIWNIDVIESFDLIQNPDNNS